MTTMCSPLRSRWAIRLAERPRMSPLTSTTVGAGPEGTFFALGAGAAVFHAIGPFAGVARTDFGRLAGFAAAAGGVEGDRGAFGVFADVGFFAGAAGSTGVTGAGAAGAAGVGGAEGVSSGKESNPRSVRL